MLPAGIIVFIVIYCLVLCCYFYTETTGNLKLRAPNKIILALMFFIFGTAYALLNAGDKGLYNTVFGYVTPLFIVALLLAALGDIFLLFSFSTGGHFFLAGNLAFIAFQLSIFDYVGLSITKYWWIFIIIIALWSIYPILTLIFPEAFNYGKYKGMTYLYLATIVTSGMLGLITSIFVEDLRLLGIGLVLFLLSDFVIVLHKFVFPKNKWVHRLNSALYFTGMLLIVLNVAMLAL